MSVIDKEIEVSKLIVKQDGDCFYPVFIDCDYCPAFRVAKEKGFDCTDLWDDDVDKQKQWFENWLSEDKQNDRD